MTAFSGGKFYIKNFGCKVNQYDSRMLAQNLETMGKTGVSSPREADIIIVNTCSVTNRSESKERSYMRNISRRYPEKEFLAVGCTVRRYKGDFKFGGAETSTGFIYLNNPRTALEKFKGHSRGFITIQQGCRGHCTYCLVKKLKKPYFIKSPEEVAAEAGRFLKNHRELVFCATNSAEYTQLDKLIKKLHDIPGEFRWRFSSLNPGSLTEENIKLLSRDERFCPHFHIPLQSASDSVLKKMNRGYSLEMVESVINTIKKYIPGSVFAFDIIVGFPGESENDYQKTVDFVEKIRPVKVHIFRFSNCEGTAAYKFRNVKRIDESV
ncbi:MAG: radical SAM protein, partial [Elusimicrobiota bacterium]|nr:radical SAM protein [Elusimicrobiota bacterium]